MPHHVALVGDSILDNGAYVQGDPCVAQQLYAHLVGADPANSVSLIAIDGDVITDVLDTQCRYIPTNTTQIILSVGGNDGLRKLATLSETYNPWLLAKHLVDFTAVFRTNYSRLLDVMGQQCENVAVCTIYQPRFGRYIANGMARVGLWFINNIIREEACTRGMRVIDCWQLFTEAADYANAIEPSAHGGEKIRREVLDLLNVDTATTVTAPPSEELRPPDMQPEIYNRLYSSSSWTHVSSVGVSALVRASW